MGVSVTAKTRGFEKGMARSARSVDRLSVATKRSTSTMALMADRLKLIAGTGLAFGGIGIFARGVAGAEKFNQGMQNSLAIMSNVTDLMRKKMETAAVEMAGKTVWSAGELAKAYFYLASAGMTAEQSLKGLPVVAQFAQAGMFDLSRATDLLTDALTAYGMASKNATVFQRNLTKMSDVLVKANTLAQATVEQFGEALATKAAAKLALYNVPLEEGVALLAAFAQAGVKGAEAGTALSIVIRDLTTKYQQNTDVFAKYGVELYDAETGALRIRRAIEQLSGAIKTLNPEQRKATLLEMGFTDKSMAFLQVQLQVADQLGTLEEQLRNAGNTTADVSDRQMTPFMRGWEAIGAASTDAMRQMQPMIDDLGEGLEKFAKWTKEALEMWRWAKGEFAAEPIQFTAREQAQTKLMEMIAISRGMNAQQIRGDFRFSDDQWNDVTEAIRRYKDEIRGIDEAAKVAADAQAQLLYVWFDNQKEKIMLMDQERIRQQKLSKEYKAMESAAGKWYGKTRTKGEKYREQLGEIMQIGAAGGFEGLGGAETFRRSVQWAADAMAKGTGTGTNAPGRGFISASQTGGAAGAKVLSDASTAQAKELKALIAIKDGIEELVREGRQGGMAA